MKGRLGRGLRKAAQAGPKLPWTVGLARHLLATLGSGDRNLQGRTEILSLQHPFGESWECIEMKRGSLQSVKWSSE